MPRGVHDEVSHSLTHTTLAIGEDANSTPSSPESEPSPSRAQKRFLTAANSTPEREH